MSDDNPYKHMQPRSMAGGLSKMQAREIRAMEAEWSEAQRRIEIELREHAEQVIADFNARLAEGKPLLASPLLRAALVSLQHWMHVHCPGCRTVKAVDLRVVPRPETIALTSIAASLRCQHCRGQAAAPTIVKLTGAHDG